jgi:hypothetical protein
MITATEVVVNWGFKCSMEKGAHCAPFSHRLSGLGFDSDGVILRVVRFAEARPISGARIRCTSSRIMRGCMHLLKSTFVQRSIVL